MVFPIHNTLAVFPPKSFAELPMIDYFQFFLCYILRLRSPAGRHGGGMDALRVKIWVGYEDW